MKVLVVGSGGREHAIIRKLKESPLVDQLYAWPGNGGISADAVCVGTNPMDIDGVVDFSTREKMDFVVVAPDSPLVEGMVDALNDAGIPTFGPKANAAIIEGSKVFSKNLMKQYNIPTAAYETFDDPDAAIEYIRTMNRFPVVVKADGLALGKGVLIPETFEEAQAAVKEIMEDKAFGSSGNHVVVEEFLRGPEVSVLAFTDGKTVKPMVSSMDHKRALDGDKGLNTGGMGTIAPNPFYSAELEELCMQQIYLPSIHAMQQEGRPFKGCLYFGLMLTQNGPYVIEYNCRFGDPETQVILPLLESDLMEIFLAIWEERLEELDIRWTEGAAACVIMASGGYPVAYEKGYPIAGLDEHGQYPGAIIYHAGTACEDGVYKTNGGRVLGVTATADTLAAALEGAYEAVNGITFTDLHYRKDIGHLVLEN